MKFAVGLLIALIVSTAPLAQNLKDQVRPAPAAPPQPAAPPPSLSEIDRLQVQLVKVSDQLAACQMQLKQADIRSAADTVRGRVESNYPGYTVNWDTGALVKKDIPAPTTVK